MLAFKRKSFPVSLLAVSVLAGGTGTLAPQQAAAQADLAEREDDTLPAGALVRLGTQRYRHEGETFSLAFSPDNKIVAAGASDGKVYLWETNTGKRIRRLDVGGFNSCYPGIAFAPDGKWLAITGYELSVWDVASGERLFRYGVAMHLGYGRAAMPVLFSPDGKQLYVPAHAKDKKVGVTVIDVSANVESRQIGVTNDRIDSLALSADGKTLALGLHDAALRGGGTAVRVLDVAANKIIRSFAFSPNGRFAAVAPDGWASHRGVKRDTSFRIRLYDLASGKEVRLFRPDGGHVASLAFSPDGSRLASGLGNGTVLLWDISATISTARAKRELPAEEMARLWTDLADADARKAYQAIRILAEHGRLTVPYIRERVSPITVASTSRLSRLIADLDSEQFTTRERALAALEKMTDAAEPALRDALRQRPTLEARDGGSNDCWQRWKVVR